MRRRFILPLWNSYSFFTTYAALDGFDPTDPANDVPLAERTLLDRWIISRLQAVDRRGARPRWTDYDAAAATRTLEHFIVEELSNWYIRRNRRRFWKTEADRDKAAAYQTLYEVLTTLTRLLAPFIPFIAEEMYQNLVRSVEPDAHRVGPPHRLSRWRTTSKVDAELDRDMAACWLPSELAARPATRPASRFASRCRRSTSGRVTRAVVDAVDRMQEQLLDELNVKALERIDDPSEYATYVIRPNFALLGPKYGKQLERDPRRP